MKNFCDGAEAFREGVEALRHDHELLEINRRIRVRAAVDDVGHRNGQDFGVGAAEVFEKRHAKGFGGGPGGGERNGEDGVRAELRLGFGAVELNHRTVNGELIQRVETTEHGKNFLGDVFDGLGDAFAEVTLFVAVAELDGFVFAGAGAGGNGGAADGAAREDDVHFNGGIAARVENLAGLNVVNRAHSVPIG